VLLADLAFLLRRRMIRAASGIGAIYQNQTASGLFWTASPWGLKRFVLNHQTNDLDQRRAPVCDVLLLFMDWKPIDTAPFDREVELAVIDGAGVHTLTFPCRRVFSGWANAETKKRLYYISPTHWRDRSPNAEPSVSTACGETAGAGTQALTQRLGAIYRGSSRVNNL
jgi:hypothetical protein